MSKKHSESSFHKKRGSSGSGDNKKAAIKDEMTLTSGALDSVQDKGGTRRPSRGSDLFDQQQQTSSAKKVNFTDGNSAMHHHKELTKQESSSGMLEQSFCGEDDSPRSQRKFISTWKMACDRTKGKTKDLLKRWRTGPEDMMPVDQLSLEEKNNSNEPGWSVHVWATWVKRYPSDEDTLETDKTVLLTETQKEKLSHFFAHIFDMDRDDIISVQDFEAFTERVRHFADWTTNSGEYIILEQVQQGFIETFIMPIRPETDDSDCERGQKMDINRLFLSIEDWLYLWGKLLNKKKTFTELPLWLQYFPKIVFNAINKSGSGSLTMDELRDFYSSVIGFPTTKVSEMIEPAFKAMTANGDFPLNYSMYRLTFANFLFGRYPNGPGLYIFGCIPRAPPPVFPIDWSAMNTPPEDNEPFDPRKKSNRTSIVV